MTANVLIKPIDDSLVAGFHAALDVVARERRFLTMLEAPPLAETRAFVLAGIGRGNPRLVAIDADQVVGWCDVSRHFFPSHAHRGSLGMGVIPSHRGQGIGRRLIETTLARAWAAGFTRVELDVHADNVPAIALYERVGFIHEGVQRDASLIDGQYRDAVAMAVVRRPGPPNADRSP